EAGAPAADAIAEQPHHRPEERSAEQRDGGDETGLRGGEAERVAQERCHRAQQHPGHEADVEVEQRRDQRRRVPGLEESRPARHAASTRAIAAGSITLTTPSSTFVAYVPTQCPLPCDGRVTAPLSRSTFHACSGQ